MTNGVRSMSTSGREASKPRVHVDLDGGDGRKRRSEGAGGCSRRRWRPQRRGLASLLDTERGRGSSASVGAKLNERRRQTDLHEE